MKKHLLLSIFLTLFAATSFAAMVSDEDSNEGKRNVWEPTAQWPFVYQDFQSAKISTSSGQTVKGMADIHVGFHYLCYENAKHDKVKAKEGTVSRVEFKNGDVYFAVDNKLCKLVREDSIHGKLCRIYRSDEVNMARFNELSRNSNMGMNTLDLGIQGLNDMYNKVAEDEGANRVDQDPLPMNTIFYMLYDGETFQVTETNVLNHIERKDRSAYRAFTRSAEILYSNEKSILAIWSTFFLE